MKKVRIAQFLLFAHCNLPMRSEIEPLNPDGGGGSGGSSSSGTVEGSTSSSSTSASESSADSSGGQGFVTSLDQGPTFTTCDSYRQDCDPGEKCVPGSLDGDGAWEVTICVPLDPYPVDIDAPCHRHDLGDDCPAGTWCWDIDPGTGLGMCIELCGGTNQAPTCQTPNTQCNTAKDGWGICFPTCDPRVLDVCPVGCACYFFSPDFQCMLDASGELGAQGDPCGFVNGCDPGHACIASENVPGCEASGCCSRICDLADPQCPDPALECRPWYEPGTAPLDGGDIGICVLAP